MNIYTALRKIHLLTYQMLYIPVPCLVTSVLFTYCWGAGGSHQPFPQLQQATVNYLC